MSVPAIVDVKHAQRHWLLASRSSRASEEATDAIDGASRALHRIQTNLSSLGYPIREFVTPCAAGLDARVARIESTTGESIPPVLREWWRRVGGVSLVDLTNYAHVGFWAAHGLAERHSDGIHINPCDEEWAEYAIARYEEFVGSDESDREVSPFAFDFSPDAPYKDGVSGEWPYALLPGGTWCALLAGFAWCYDRPLTAAQPRTDFLSYLRTALLECAGFPGFYGHAAFRELKDVILSDVAVF